MANEDDIFADEPQLSGLFERAEALLAQQGHDVEALKAQAAANLNHWYNQREVSVDAEVETKSCRKCGTDFKPTWLCRIGGREEYTETCSRFCEEVPQATVDAWKAGLPAGEWAAWPCSGCGKPLEDAYPGKDAAYEASICMECHDAWKLKVRSDLLTECLPHVPAELAQRIQALLQINATTGDACSSS